MFTSVCVKSMKNGLSVIAPEVFFLDRHPRIADNKLVIKAANRPEALFSENVLRLGPNSRDF